MKKYFRPIIFLTMSVLILSLCSCSKSISAKDDALYFPTKSDQTDTLEATMSAPKDMNELYNGSEAVIVCSIVGEDQTLCGSVDMAISKAKIEKVIKGDLTVGETVNIQETGLRREQGDLSIDGVPLLRNNMKVMLFLSGHDDVVMDGETSYGINGCYYGKFFYDEDNVLHSAADFASESNLKLSDFTNPVKEQTMLEKINGIAESAVKNAE